MVERASAPHRSTVVAAISHGPAPAGDRAGSRSPTRRTLLRLFGVTAPLQAAFTACGQATSPATRGGPEAAGSVTWAYSANPQSTGFDRIEAAFRQKYPKITLEVLNQAQDFYDQMLAMFAAGNPPDVFRLNDDFVKAWYVKHLLAPLDGYMKASGVKKDDYYDAIINFPVQEGKVVSWFLGANPRLIYYNVDLFRRFGVSLPPKKWENTGWTFDDFVDTARKLTHPNEQPPIYGAAAYDDTGNEQTFSINNGSPTGIYSKDGLKFTLADPPGYEAIQWIADLTHKHRVQPTRQVASDHKGTDDMFINQMLAMRFTSTGFINRIRRDAPSMNWDVAPIPMRAVRRNEGSIQTYALVVGAKNPDNGWHLLHFFTEQEVARIFIDTGYVIPAKKAFAKDYIAAQKKASPSLNAELIVDSFNYQTQPNQTLDTPAARRIYRGSNLNEIWDGLVTAKEGLNRVRAAVEAAIAPK